MSDIKFWVWLTTRHGIASRKITYLLNKFDTAEDIYNADRKSFAKIDGINKTDIDALCDKDMGYVDKVLSDCKKYGFRVLTYESPLYPQNLCHIYDPPYVLYVKSKERIDLNKHLCVSVVGNRRITRYGQKVTDDICGDLTKGGVTIVSGMARGVDGAAHRAALDAGGITVAVLGCGLDICYPPEHKELMDEIAETGLVISEYTPGTAPLARNFPRRNRIISGISAATLITEAASGSGSLITANIAMEQNREIFAVPGDITNRHSDGCNGLICNLGAKAITSGADILSQFAEAYADILNANKPKNNPNKRKKPKKEECLRLTNDVYARLSQKEKHIVKKMSKEPIHIDKISNLTGISVNDISAVMTLLEIAGVVKAYPGKKFGLNI